MYKLVSAAESRIYRLNCSNILKRTCDLLKKENIVAQYVLVGSGARNMITRNGNGPFDLDYNLEIIKAPNEYGNDLRRLKDTVRILLDKAAGLTCFSESQASTSCLTALLYFKDKPNVEFSFDVAIVMKNSNGTLCKLVRNKNAWGSGRDQYVWNEIPSSGNIKQKARKIKAEHLWQEVRERYVELKNLYLSRSLSNEHPSFIVYIEAVNETYYKKFH